MTDSSAKICRWLGRAWCSASGSFGIQGSAGSWSVRPGPDGSGRTYSRPRTGPASGRRSAFVRRERSDRPVGWRRAAKPWVRSARLPARVWGFRAMSQLRPGRRPIVSEFLTMSSASVQRVHATECRACGAGHLSASRSDGVRFGFLRRAVGGRAAIRHMLPGLGFVRHPERPVRAGCAWARVARGERIPARARVRSEARGVKVGRAAMRRAAGFVRRYHEVVPAHPRTARSAPYPRGSSARAIWDRPSDWLRHAHCSRKRLARQSNTGHGGIPWLRRGWLE